jgi:ATPase subunit of ABC transporter with duplicated ATPase domains
MLFTSHDHQFVQTIANRIIDVTTGHFRDKQTTFDEYCELV